MRFRPAELVIMRKKWVWALVASSVACVLAAGCSEGQGVILSASPSMTSTAVPVNDETPRVTALAPAATRPPLPAAERAAVLKAWPQKREAAKSSINGLSWSQGPVLKGFMRTKSSEWQGTPLLPAPPPKDSPLMTRPIPDYYDVWVVGGVGVMSCGAYGAKCAADPSQQRVAMIYGSDGELYASLSWDNETGASPPELAAIGIPAEEFDVA